MNDELNEVIDILDSEQRADLRKSILPKGSRSLYKLKGISLGRIYGI